MLLGLSFECVLFVVRRKVKTVQRLKHNNTARMGVYFYAQQQLAKHINDLLTYLLTWCVGDEHSQVRVGWCCGESWRRYKNDSQLDGDHYRMYGRHHIRRSHHSGADSRQMDGRLLQPGQLVLMSVNKYVTALFITTSIALKKSPNTSRWAMVQSKDGKTHM